MQSLDLFAEFATTPELPISKRSTKNHRAFEDANIKIERWKIGQLQAAIKIARDRLGYHWGIEYRHSQGGTGGPVFIKATPLETYHDARLEAIAELKLRLSRSFLERSKPLLKSITEAMETIK